MIKQIKSKKTEAKPDKRQLSFNFLFIKQEL